MSAPVPDDGPRLLVRDDGAVRTLVLNRPSRRNALDDPLLDALCAALRAAAADESVRDRKSVV